MHLFLWVGRVHHGATGSHYHLINEVAGESRRYSFLTMTKAIFVILGLWIGVQTGGLIGALIGQGLGNIAAYPALVWLSSRVGVWDPLHDVGFAVLGLMLACGAIWWNWDAIAALAA